METNSTQIKIENTFHRVVTEVYFFLVEEIIAVIVEVF